MKNEKRVLVAGATGFVGRNIVEHLYKRRFETYPLVRRDTLSKKRSVIEAYERLGVKILVIDSFDRERLRDLFRQIRPNVVINTIGIFKGSREEFLKSHVYIAEEILGAVEILGENILYIHISSIGASNMDLDKPVREEEKHCSHLEYLKTYYEMSKCLGEIRVREICDEKSISYVILRPSLIIGEYNTHREWIDLMRLSRVGVELDIDTKLNILDVRDLVRIIELIIERRDLYNEFYHIASPREITLRDISRVALEIVGRRSLIKITSSTIKLLYSISKVFLSDIDRRFIEMILSGDARISSEKFIRKTSYTFTDPLDSVKRYLGWLRESV
ncbi:MAG: NAD-dependent epimerase/dehydratase family protein [Sulfolobales archaeon]